MTGLHWDWAFAWSILPDLLDGLEVTIEATLCGIVIALVLGLLWTVLRLAEVPLVGATVDFVVHFLRGTPLLIQLYFLFYVFPSYGVTLSAFTTGIIGLGVYYSAVASEIYRAGIEATPQGQWEACLTLGLPLRWIWTHVVLPPALRNVTPMLGNIAVVMIKDSALLSTITVTELLAKAMEVGQMEFRFIEPLTLAAALYMTVSYALVLLVRLLERWSATRAQP
jgi:polar amino acid transport system permease protein